MHKTMRSVYPCKETLWDCSVIFWKKQRLIMQKIIHAFNCWTRAPNHNAFQPESLYAFFVLIVSVWRISSWDYTRSLSPNFERLGQELSKIYGDCHVIEEEEETMESEDSLKWKSCDSSILTHTYGGETKKKQGPRFSLRIWRRWRLPRYGEEEETMESDTSCRMKRKSCDSILTHNNGETLYL